MTIATIPTLSPEGAVQSHARDLYDSAGCLLVPNIFGFDEMSTMAEVFTRKVESDGTFANRDGHIAQDDVLAKYPRFVHPHRWPETEAGAMAQKLMFDARLKDIAQNLIGPLYGAQSMFHFKPPTARGQAMHQDNAFVQVHPETCIAAWIAVDDADGDNGGLIVVPGSHKGDLLCHGEADPAESFATRGLPMCSDGVQTTLKRGDVLFFHGGIIHGSLRNTTKDRFRRALIYHYIPQTSVEISDFYQPLVHPAGHEFEIDVSKEGDLCGGEGA